MKEKKNKRTKGKKREKISLQFSLFLLLYYFDFFCSFQKQMKRKTKENYVFNF
jgi:hypothetical protein